MSLRNSNAANIARGLRELADAIERTGITPSTSMSFCVFADDRDDMAQFAREMAPVRKDADDNYFRLIRRFSGGVILKALAGRSDVCERVQIGEKTLPATPETVVPASPERIIPAQPERTEPIYEWRCPESILAGSRDAAADYAEIDSHKRHD